MRSAKRMGFGIACIIIAIGIILVIIGLAAGGGRLYKSTSSYHFEDSIEGAVDSLDLEVAYGTVNLVTGDEFQISVYNMDEDEVKNYVKDGTWYIRQKDDNDYAINIFGINLSLFSFGVNQDLHVDTTPRIVITIPEDFSAEDMDIKLSAGTLTAEQLVSSKLSVEVSAGSMEVEKLVVSDSGTLECGAGELIVHEIEGKDIKVNCGLGSIKLSGVLVGENSVECGIGSVILDLNGEEEDYDYSVDCGIGNVIINNRSYGGTTHKSVRNDGAQSSFDLECDIGEIQLYIR